MYSKQWQTLFVSRKNVIITTLLTAGDSSPQQPIATQNNPWQHRATLAVRAKTNPKKTPQKKTNSNSCPFCVGLKYFCCRLSSWIQYLCAGVCHCVCRFPAPLRSCTQGEIQNRRVISPLASLGIVLCIHRLQVEAAICSADAENEQGNIDATHSHTHIHSHTHSASVSITRTTTNRQSAVSKVSLLVKLCINAAT